MVACEDEETQAGTPGPAAAAADVPPEVAQGLERSLEYLAGVLLEERHYSRLHASFASKWDRNQSLQAAVKLMEQYGVQMTPEDEEELGRMDEEAMIDTLVCKMPNQSKEEFQSFFMQLQLVVSTAARVRQALEDCDVAGVEAALEEAEHTGIANCILKMALVQAGSQVISMKQQHAVWVRDAESRMGKLLRGQEDVMHSRKRLALAQGQLRAYETAHCAKAMKVLSTLLSGQSTVIAKLTLLAWSATAKQERIENEVFEEYKERIEQAQLQLMETRAKARGASGSILERTAKAKESALLEECFFALRDDARRCVEERAEEANVAEMQSKLQAFSDSQLEGAKRVMARMMEGMASTVLTAIWQAWFACVEETRHDRASDDAVQKAKAGLEQKLATGKENAVSIIGRLQQSNDTGIAYTHFKQWVDLWKEEKSAREMASILQKSQSKLLDFSGRTAGNAQKAMERASSVVEQLLLLHVFTQWSLDSRLSQIYNANIRRLDGKRKQLGKVQTMFREFAVQLEDGLKQSLENDTHWATRPNRGGESRKQLSKSDGAASLPNIHGGHQPRGSPTRGSPVGSSKRSGSVGSRTSQQAGYPPEERPHDTPQPQVPQQAWH